MGRAILQPYPGPSTTLLCSLQSTVQGCPLLPRIWSCPLSPPSQSAPASFSSQCILYAALLCSCSSVVWEPTSHCTCRSGLSSFPHFSDFSKIRYGFEIVTFVLFSDSVHALLALLALTHLHLNYIVVFPINQYHYKIEHPRNRVTYIVTQ